MPAKREYVPVEARVLLGPQRAHDGDGFIRDGARSLNVLPIASISFSIAPTPTPRITRPPLSTSSVATVFASPIGLWYGSTSTEVPRRTRSVRAATKLRRVSGS